MYNVLLELDGSADALAALNIAESLSHTSPQVLITAHYVVDSQAVWKFLGMEKPGLIGCGPYFQACESITSSLYELMETVSLSYQARCGHLEQFSKLVVDEGEFATMVEQRAADLKALVLIGKSTLLRNAEAAKSTVSEIATTIHSPLIVVDQTALLCGCGCFRLLSTRPGECCTENISPDTIAHLLTASSQTKAPRAA